MTTLTKLRLLLAIPLIIYGAYLSSQNSASYERNKQPEENIRQARSVAQSWSSGVSSKYIPKIRPATAEARLQTVFDSDADEAVKQKAHKVHETLNRYPYFVRFADGIEGFIGEFDRIRSVIDKVSIPLDWKSGRSDQKIQPQCLVITDRKHQAGHPPEDRDELYFDAEMMDALGDSLATSPKELRTLIVLYFSSTKIGEYRFPHENESANRKGEIEPYRKAAFAHQCRVVVINLATESVVDVKRFAEADPEKRKLVLLGSGQSSKGGHALLRDKVRRWIQKNSSPIR